jgi:AcrR family transcriptional regulator
VTEVGLTTRQRIVRGAVELTASDGWSALTMGRLAAHVGVSRQTVYNETGSKRELAEAVVLDELGRFLDVVDDAFASRPRDLRAAIERSVSGILALAGTSPLLRAVVAPGAGDELLPPLTTDASAVIAASAARVSGHLDARGVAPGPRRDAAVDMLVRTVLSHVMQPSADPQAAASAIASLSAAALTSDEPALGRARPV